MGGFVTAGMAGPLVTVGLGGTQVVIVQEREEKGKEIYRLWKEDRKQFEKYAVGDVIDLHLILEKLMLNDFQFNSS